MQADRTGARPRLGARCASGARALEEALLRSLMLMSAFLQRMPRYTCSSMAPCSVQMCRCNSLMFCIGVAMQLSAYHTSGQNTLNPDPN